MRIPHRFRHGRTVTERLEPVVVNDPPEATDGKPRKARAMVGAAHLRDPGNSPRPEVVAALDEAFAAMVPPCRRVGEPLRKTPREMADLTGVKPVAYEGWPEWWYAEGEEIPR